VRCTPVRCTPVRCTPVRCTPVRYTAKRCTSVRCTPAQTSSPPPSSLNSSPLSSPPSRLDHNLERLDGIERSVVDKVVLPDKAQRMEFALEEYTGQNDQKELVWALSKKMLARDLESKRSVQTKARNSRRFPCKARRRQMQIPHQAREYLEHGRKGLHYGRRTKRCE
jgi:hypothetical protein